MCNALVCVQIFPWQSTQNVCVCVFVVRAFFRCTFVLFSLSLFGHVHKIVVWHVCRANEGYKHRSRGTVKWPDAEPTTTMKEKKKNFIFPLVLKYAQSISDFVWNFCFALQTSTSVCLNRWRIKSISTAGCKKQKIYVRKNLMHTIETRISFNLIWVDYTDFWR